MAEIKFKATRKLHSSGYRILDKSGDLEFDVDPLSKDGVWILVTAPTRVMVDCDREGNYRLRFGAHSVQKVQITRI